MAKRYNLGTRLEVIDKVFESAPDLVTLVNNRYAEESNKMFWAQNFVKDGMPSPIDAYGSATFKVTSVVKTGSPMLDVRAAMTETSQNDKDGFESYLGTIPDLGRGFQTSTGERLILERMFSDMGIDSTDASIMTQYLDSLDKLVDGAHASLSNMSAQLLSTGIINYNYGQGAKYVQESKIDPLNKVKAVGKVWSDKTSGVFTQMNKIEQAFRDRTGYQGAMKWQVTEKMMKEVILVNEEVISYINQARTVSLGANALVSTPANVDLLNQAIVFLDGFVSPIEIVKEKQTEQTLIGRNVVNGWAEGIAVLRPVGFAGVIKYAQNMDVLIAQRYQSPAAIKTTASLLGGIAGVVNTVVDKGGNPNWHTDIFMTAAPALTEFPFHVIVDTKTAV